MAITVTQNKSIYSGTASSVLAHMASNTTATNTLIGVFCFGIAGGSVVSVNDSTQNRWIQIGTANNSMANNAEIWVARGIQGGNASVSAVYSTASVGANFFEASNVWFQSPTDTWSQQLGTSASVTPQRVFPRTTGDLAVIVGNSAASVNGAPSGWTALSVPGSTGFSAAYQVLSGSVVPQSYWGASGASPWAAIEAAFLPINSTTIGAGTGGAGLNPLLQFPEVSVQVSESQDYQAAFKGTAMWTEVAPYVQSMSLGPIGRAHLLDRVQASHGVFTMNGRDGTWNPWNTASFLWPYGLDPMTTIKVVASWQGVCSPIFWGYCQSFTPQIQDALNVSVDVEAYDLLQELSLAYLSGNQYQQAILAGN